MLYNIELNNENWLINEYDKREDNSQDNRRKVFFSDSSNSLKIFKKRQTQAKKESIGLFLNPYEILKSL